MGEPLEASSAAPPGLPSAECLQHMPGAGDAVGTSHSPSICLPHGGEQSTKRKQFICIVLVATEAGA